jgi:hypothetical protein
MKSPTFEKIDSMIHRKKTSDERFDGMCAYCGDFPDSRDHVPSKVLLDEPFPENLPVVECCIKCNQGLSVDEEYFACAIECLKFSTTDVGKLKREKIKKILTRRPALQARLAESFVIVDGQSAFSIDVAAFENVILKLARGHVSFEASAPVWRRPDQVAYQPVYTMTEEEQEDFFLEPEITLYPEIGSRMFIQMIENRPGITYSAWNEVQKGCYYYLINVSQGEIKVRIFISDILAIECIWHDEDNTLDA